MVAHELGHLTGTGLFKKCVMRGNFCVILGVICGKIGHVKGRFRAPSLLE